MNTVTRDLSSRQTSPPHNVPELHLIDDISNHPHPHHPSSPEVIENPTTPQLSSALIHQNPIPDLRSWIWTNTAKNDARGTKCIVILSIHLYPYPKKDGKETHPTRKSMWDNLFRC